MTAYGDPTSLDERCCAFCGLPVTGREFVLQVSTAHLRWFCSVDCVVMGQEASREELAAKILADPNY